MQSLLSVQQSLLVVLVVVDPVILQVISHMFLQYFVGGLFVSIFVLVIFSKLKRLATDFVNFLGIVSVVGDDVVSSPSSTPPFLLL
jgi:hypothetical protein